MLSHGYNRGCNAKASGHSAMLCYHPTEGFKVNVIIFSDFFFLYVSI